MCKQDIDIIKNNDKYFVVNKLKEFYHAFSLINKNSHKEYEVFREKWIPILQGITNNMEYPSLKENSLYIDVKIALMYLNIPHDLCKFGHVVLSETLIYSLKERVASYGGNGRYFYEGIILKKNPFKISLLSKLKTIVTRYII